MPALLDALTPVGIFAIIFGTITAHRYMRHRETIKLIEHGYPPDALRGGRYAPPVVPPAPAPVAWPPMPPAPPSVSAPPLHAEPPPEPFPDVPPAPVPHLAPPYPAPVAPPPPHRGNRAQLLWGCILAGVGVALSLALWPIGFAVNAGGSVVFPLGIGPWMVAGFIPLFVGLALLLAYTVASPRALAPPPPASRLASPRHPHEGGEAERHRLS